jgi:hypothetical protein
MDFSGTTAVSDRVLAVVLAGEDAARFGSDNLSTTKYVTATAATTAMVTSNSGFHRSDARTGDPVIGVPADAGPVTSRAVVGA